MIQKILCLLGFHDWIYEDNFDDDFPVRRVCLCTKICRKEGQGDNLHPNIKEHGENCTCIHDWADCWEKTTHKWIKKHRIEFGGD